MVEASNQGRTTKLSIRIEKPCQTLQKMKLCKHLILRMYCLYENTEKYKMPQQMMNSHVYRKTGSYLDSVPSNAMLQLWAHLRVHTANSPALDLRHLMLGQGTEHHLPAPWLCLQALMHSLPDPQSRPLPSTPALFRARRNDAGTSREIRGRGKRMGETAIGVLYGLSF